MKNAVDEKKEFCLMF